jgi:hypothetical protein
MTEHQIEDYIGITIAVFLFAYMLFIVAASLWGTRVPCCECVP